MLCAWACFALALASATERAQAQGCVAVAVWHDGRHTEDVCAANVGARGLTLLDLSDEWTPAMLAVGPDGDAPDYRATYDALANERFASAGIDAVMAPFDRFFELYGIEPSMTVVRARLADDERHHCHDAIDNGPLASGPDRFDEESRSAGLQRIAQAREQGASLERERVAHDLADLDSLAALSPYFRHAVRRWRSLDGYVAAVRVVQAHLACDQLLLDRPLAGAYTWQTSNAVQTFQRGAMLLPTGRLDAESKQLLLLASRERDFRVALRVLRERVVAAAGLIEDGTAGDGPGQVRGRALDPASTWTVRDQTPIEGAAPDQIAAATETAARALGWQDAASTRQFLDLLASSSVTSRVVAIQLPPAPPYYAPDMKLSVEIDRGDSPGHTSRPQLIVYAITADQRIALVRWPTTVGGWQNQLLGGSIRRRFKKSPIGPRVWRDLLVGPRWLPPATTPDRELTRTLDDHTVLDRQQFGPSYRGAFGIAAFVHLLETPDGARTTLEDQGIRTHGTGNLASLSNGVSHGCHRVLGRNVVRLADFVLAHHDFIRRGDTPTAYHRVIRDRGEFPLDIRSTGYRFELVPPIVVEVLAGSGPHQHTEAAAHGMSN